jgi:hypothetical protein
VGGFQGLVHDTGQVIADRFQVDRVFQPGRERGHGLIGVIPSPVEPRYARTVPGTLPLRTAPLHRATDSPTGPEVVVRSFLAD